MLTSLHIGNFKAFAETQNIPIRPITLIFGPNSAGKSSIIHSLALAHEASRKGDLDIFRTEVGGSSIDLGGFRQYVHRREVIRRVEWGTTFETRHLKGRLAELLKPIQSISLHLTIGVELDDMGEPVRDAIPEVISYELESKGDTILRMSSRTNNTMAVDRLSFRHPVIRQIVEAVLQGYTTTQNISEDDYESLNEAFFNIVEDLIATEIVFLPTGVIDKGKMNDDKDSPTPFFSVSKGNRTEDLGRALRFFLPRSVNELVTGLTNEVRKELQRMQYLGPLRSYPARHIAFSEHDDLNWYAGGGYAWDVVRKNSSVREKVNNWLSDPVRLQTPYELKVENLSHFDDLDATYEYEISQIEQRFSMNEELNEPPVLDLFGEIYGVFNILKKCADHDARIQELILYDKRTQTRVSHRDVGIGVSQVLPVLVGAYASQNQIITIEQPEIHLHPSLQAELADVFIESALGEQKNTFILETHSEHLILRLMRRMRQTADDELPEGLPRVTPDDVSILYVQPTKTGSVVRVLELDSEGQFLDPWPGGFFEEGFRERFA